MVRYENLKRNPLQIISEKLHIIFVANSGEKDLII